MNTPDTPQKQSITIFDTTLRDGEQWAGGALRMKEKIEIAHQLSKTGVDVIEAGFPASSDLDFNSVRIIAEEVKGPRIAGLARANRRDIERVAAALVCCAKPRIHVFIATSEIHMRHKLGKTPDQVLRSIDDSVRFAKSCVQEKGDVEWSAEDASRSSINFLITAVRVAIDAGATTINLPDTVGFVRPSPYADMFRTLMAEVKPGPHIVFSAHVHNDRGLAIANSMAAIEAGARQVECSIRGVGERAGNAQLEAVILNIMMSGDTPFTCNIDRTQLIPTAKLHAAFVPDISVMLPVSGANAFAHGSGIHQDGMLKAGCYEYMEPSDYGHQEGTSFPLTRHSGMAGIGAVLNHQDVFLSPSELSAFAEMFKNASSDALETKGLRIIPPDMAAHWARNFVNQYCQKPAA